LLQTKDEAVVAGAEQSSGSDREMCDDPLEAQLRSLIHLLHKDASAAGGAAVAVHNAGDVGVSTKDLLAEHINRGKKIMDV
jgi:hypothetical protein